MKFLADHAHNFDVKLTPTPIRMRMAPMAHSPLGLAGSTCGTCGKSKTADFGQVVKVVLTAVQWGSKRAVLRRFANMVKCTPMMAAALNGNVNCVQDWVLARPSSSAVAGKFAPAKELLARRAELHCHRLKVASCNVTASLSP